MNFAEWKKNRKTKEQTAVATEVTAPATPTFSQWVAAKKETSSVEGWLNSVSGFLGDVQTRYQGYNASAEDYNSTFVRSQELLSAADNWRKQYARDAAATQSIDRAVAMLSQAQEYAKGYYDFYSQWATSDEYEAWAKNQEMVKGVLSAPDLDEYAAAGEAKGVLPSKRNEWYNQIAYLRNNPDEMARYERSSEEAGGAFGKSLTANLLQDQMTYKAAKYMTDEEYAIYNYLVGKGELEQAEAYLASIEGNLDEERGKAITAEVQGKRLKELKFAFDAGTNQFWHGLANAGSMAFGLDDTYVNESLMYANAKIGGSVKGLHKVAYDLTSTTANMLPSIFLSMASPNAGVTAMGLSAAGNAYTEMQRLGYDNITSRNYAALVGASEAVLQKVLGGISSLGGASEGIFQKIASKILPKVDRALARVALELGASMADEGLEEALQSVLEPIFKRITTGESFEGIDWEEVAYSGLLGVLSAGLLEGAPAVAGTAYNSIQSKKYYSPDQAALLDEALELNPGNKYVQSLKAKADSGKTLSGMELNRLVEMNEGKIADIGTDATTDTTSDTLESVVTEETKPVEGKASAGEAKAAEVGKSATEEKRGAEAEYEPYSAPEAETNTDARSALAAASKKYGRQAGAMVALYREGQDVDAYNRAFGMAYDMGKAGVSLSYAMNSEATQYLTEDQRKLAHQIGAEATSAKAEILDKHNKSLTNGKEGRRKGAVKGEGVTVAELRETFNDTQGVAYKILSTFAEATGIDIVLYKSKPNAKGDYEGAQGRFKWKENTIYVDVNAGHTNVKSVGDLAKYTMVRTFGHEFVHFLEKWNPIRYAEFRRVVFDSMETNGEDVDGLIRIKMEQDDSGKMTYDLASREVVAEAMADVLPDANFVRELAEKHKTIFDKLLEQFKAFVADLKAYFNTIQRGRSSTREAKALMEQVGDSVKYAESIVKLFDRVAVEAVEAYQRTVAEDVVSEEVSEEVVDDVIEDIPEDISEQIAEEIPEEAPAEAEEEGGDAFVITDNPEYGSLEIKFDGKPPEVVREALKAKKFRWNGKRGIWYGKAERADIIRDLREAYKAAEAAPVEEAPAVEAPVSGAVAVENVAETPVSDTSTTQNGAIMAEEASEVVETGNETEVVKEEQPVAISEEDLIQEKKAFDKKFGAIDKSKWMVADLAPPEKGQFILDGSLAIRVSDRELVVARAEYGRKYNLPSFGFIPEHLSEVLKKATTLVTEPPVVISGHPKPLFVFTFDGKSHFWDKKRLSALDGNTFYVGDFQEKYKILKAVDENGEIAGFVLPVNPRNITITDPTPSRLKTFSKKKQATTKTTEEVTENVENADNQRAVQQPDENREGDSRVLDEVEAQDVPRDGASGDTLGDAEERGQEAGRDGLRPDRGESSVGGHGDGDRESGDLRRDGRLTTHKEAKQIAEETPAAESTPDRAEELHEEVAQEIEQKSTENPRGRNFVIGDSLDLPSGEKARYKANVEAIRLVKRLEAEGRHATEAEQVILSKYVGWGGLANAFNDRAVNWMEEAKELRQLLTEDEYRAARASTLSAFFTDISIVKAMYDGLSRLGFNGGRMLEPSSGVGNFVGAMPVDMSSKVKSWTMVELDSITGLIAKYLYPNADVRIQGFEKANIPDNYMDVVIGNVPFGNDAIYDKKYPKKVTSAIHNYFIAKALDKVRPGGIVMVITSAYTMNSKDSTVRRYIMSRADLLGAIRLPDTAFAVNAGTDAVSDILILKKRAENTPYDGVDFLESPFRYVSGHNGSYINDYFTNHPEMALGTPAMVGTRYDYSLTYKAFTDRGSLADQIREAFSRIEGKMDYPAVMSRERTNLAVERATKKLKQNGLVVKDGKVFRNEGGELVEQKVAKGAVERISGMLGIRDAARDLLNFQQQGLSEEEISKARAKLNKVYDDFVKKYGYLNAQTNRNALAEDPDKFSLQALEHWDPDKKVAKKADIFTKNTITPNRTATSAKDVSEGLIVSVNQTGGVDTELIARLTGKTEEDVTRELIDSRLAFKNRDGVLEPAEVYLSGNVRAKLRDAEALVSFDEDYRNNVDALLAVIPEDVGYQDIFVNPGTPWIPNSVYSDFAAYMLGGRNSEWRQDVDVTRNGATGSFTVDLKSRHLKSNYANNQKWGTSRRSFLDLFDAMLNSKSVVVKDKQADGSTVVNRDETAAANEKMENIRKEFQDWLWRDDARRKELSTLYNEVFNSIVTPKYNGDHLTVNGANAEKSLRPHQRNAVQRVISSGGNTLLAHKVGAGKTYEMAASAMKLKELGLIRKPMFVVPKSLVSQWGSEFMDFFPVAKILVAEASDFTPANRKVFMNRVANNEYDAVIVSYEQFEKLPISDDFARALYQEQIDSIVAALEEAKAEKGDRALSVKDLEKKRKSLQTKIDKLTDKAKDEDNISFEQLGVDSLFVDEAHNFKNLFYTTAMTNVSGLGNKDGSKRAFDLYTKVRYLQKLNGGRGIVFATATPVMNSMSEMYIMQRYLQPDLLDQLGLSTFDAWAKQFGEVVNGVEIKPSGQGYRVKQSFSRFKNMSELQLLFRNFADVLTEIPGLEIPKMRGGKVNVVVCEPGQFQQDFMKELEKRADNIKNVDPSVDNMLKITSDGRKISYTQRMIDPTLPYEEGCKIFRCADNVVKEYKDSSAIKGTQLVFCDMATPKGRSKTEATAEDADMDMESAQLYDDMKARMVAGGIPANEIAFIHDADTDAKKKKLFDDVNEGKVRVLIGSTGKMGVGMNAQKRIVAIHHLDAPWRPGDVEQRDGRAFRQKNINKEVAKYTYVTEGSFDARLWDILERKQNFIDQVMNGESVGREAEDTGEVTLSAAEVKALASGSPLIMEQVQLDTDIKKLESLYRAHTSAVRAAREKLSADRGTIAKLESNIEGGKADIASRKNTYTEENFSITIGRRKYTDKKEAGVALMAEATAKANAEGYTTVATFAGFELKVIKTSEGIKGIVQGRQVYPFNTYPTNTTMMMNRLMAVVEGIDNVVKVWQTTLSEVRADLVQQEAMISEPFAKQAELDKKRARYNEVMAILNPKEEQSLEDLDEDTEQEQSRSYLDDDYSTDGVHWGIGIGVMTKADARAVWNAVANINKLRYVSYPTTDYGEHFVESNNLLMIVDANYKRPVVRTIFKFNDEYETTIWIAKEEIINARGNESEIEKACRVIEDVFGKGYVERYDFESRSSYAGKDGRGEGDLGGADSEQNQQRVNTLTDREVLSMAADRLDTAKLTEGERFALETFQKRLETLQGLSEERAEQGKLYKEQQFGEGGDRAAAAETLRRMRELDGKIKDANDALLSLENKDILRQVLVKARKVVEEQERQHGKEILDRWRERTRNAAAIKKYRDRIQADITELSGWILKPDSKSAIKHVPDVLKSTVIPLLTSIDFTSKRKLRGGEATKADETFLKRLEKLQKSLKDGDMSTLYADYDLPPRFMENLGDFIDTVKTVADSGADGYVINLMTAEELKELSSLIRVLKSTIVKANKFMANAMFQHVEEAGNSTISELSAMESNNGQANGVSNFVFWQQIRPAYAFERFGDGGKAIYDGLRRGQAQLAFNTEQIVEFSKETYAPEEVKEWDDSVLDVSLSDGTVAKIKVSQAMSFYELYKQEDSKVHILGGGVRISTYTTGGKKISDGGHRLTEQDAEKIIAALTPRQKEVADKLQRFMADQGGAWGNYVSIARFGEKMFTNEQYFPINSDGQLLPATADKAPENASLYALLNMSFTKSRKEGANNRVVLYSIFDVFSNHMASMAQYNAMALPVLDAVKWFNYRQKDPVTRENVTGVRDQMIRVYGAPEEGARGGRMGYAEAFVMGILKSFNGTEAQGAQSDSFGMTTLRRYNMAQIAYNFRVVVQQPLSILRAALLIDYASIARGLRLSPKAIQANVKEMQEHSGIAAWKALGFYDVNISRGLTDVIKNKSTKMDKIREFGMLGAEKMDTITWAAIWSACKEEVSRKRGIRPDSEGYFDAVTTLFEDVIYKTQVVDSILTKNEFMRSKGFWSRAIGSFMSEPVTTASMVVNAYDKYNLDRKRGMDSHAAWAKNKAMIGRTMYVYAISQTVLAAVTAVIDGLRDDDDYEEFYEKWLDAFAGNAIDELLPFNKLPILSDFYDLAKEILSILGVDTYGNPPQSVFMQWYDALVKGVQILYDKITGEDTNYTWYSGIYKMLQAVSGMVGMPAASATREIVTAWNNTVGAMAPSLKVKTYDAGELSSIKFSYEDGHLTAEEASKLILEKGLADNEDEAYFIISGWEAGEGYSRYDAVYDAVLNGGDFDAAVGELVAHGYKRDEVIAQVKSEIGSWYADEESEIRITKQRAIELLDKYTDLSHDEINKVVNRWSSKVVTGIAYGDIADEFMSGKMTANRAVEMYTRYGSMTREEAKQKVELLTFIKKHPECEDMTYEAMDGYKTYCEPVGVSASVFYKAWKHSSTVKADADKNGKPVSGSKKAKMLQYIDSLRLSSRQKDGLYRAFGWSDDGLSDTPWH